VTAFEDAAERYRRELFAYCYRMLGSPHDADDAVQETYLRAWRAFDGFQGRSSVRTWLYRIATRACLRAIEGRARRALPSGLGAPAADPAGPIDPRDAEIGWVEPVSATELDPATITEARHGIRLAFVAALQRLPARQRAVLILRDVLVFHADEVADLLDSTVPAVNSALQRARAQLARTAPDGYDLAEPADPARRTLLDRYAAAFENADIDELVRVLAADAVLEMPPIPTWFRGRDHVAEFLRRRLTRPGRRLLPTVANGQPAFGLYVRGHGGVARAHALQLLTLGPDGVARIDMIHDPSLFPRFGLPHLAGTSESAAGQPFPAPASKEKTCN
jgi:RNA polymerase sigma-70 factor (ECF subfamily)